MTRCLHRFAVRRPALRVHGFHFLDRFLGEIERQANSTVQDRERRFAHRLGPRHKTLCLRADRTGTLDDFVFVGHRRVLPLHVAEEAECPGGSASSSRPEKGVAPTKGRIKCPPPPAIQSTQLRVRFRPRTGWRTPRVRSLESTDCERRDRLGKAAPLLAEALEQCNGSPACVDLADVTFLDSTGIAVLVAANKRASERATEFTIRNAAPNVRRVFEITGLDDLLAFEPN